MHEIEPYYNWENYYQAQNDELSPLYGKRYNMDEYENTIYGYYVHPAWDFIGSETLYLKVLFVDYKLKYAIIELMGEWNDTVHNDVMYLKRELIDVMQKEGIYKFILIGENILNFHGSYDDDYYSEWYEEVDDENGWIAAINFRDFVQQEMTRYRLSGYMHFGGTLDIENWRTFTPFQLYATISGLIERRLNP